MTPTAMSHIHIFCLFQEETLPSHAQNVTRPDMLRALSGVKLFVQILSADGTRKQRVKVGLVLVEWSTDVKKTKPIFHV